ncbi:unnamed protein product [Brassicogethes aeneus]|uniref:Regulatory protein zeste n=1 Tax=Brassicogethes aeneus TaxID=1431903 RepID=A0A9P0FJA8_BRAAE|nr:unnamed protein product [Brassicogethes aeneus]
MLFFKFYVRMRMYNGNFVAKNEMEVKKERLSSVNRAQKSIITEFMESHPELRSGQFSNSFSHKNAQALWSELLSLINSVPGGGRKETWQQIRKCWQDMKKKVKQKKTLLNKYYAGTGGGGPPTNDLDQEDEKILQLLPAVSVSGDPNISESAVTFVFETSDFEQLIDDRTQENEGNETNSQVLHEVTNVSCNIARRSTNYYSEVESSSSTEKLNIKQKYYQKKLELIEEDSKRRELYENKKLELLGKQVDALEKIAENLSLPRYPQTTQKG